MNIVTCSTVFVSISCSAVFFLSWSKNSFVIFAINRFVPVKWKTGVYPNHAANQCYKILVFFWAFSINTEIAVKSVLTVLVEWLNRHQHRPKNRAECLSKQNNIRISKKPNPPPKIEQQSIESVSLPLGFDIDTAPTIDKMPEAINNDKVGDDLSKVQPFSFINQILRKCDSQLKRSGMDVCKI